MLPRLLLIDDAEDIFKLVSRTLGGLADVYWAQNLSQARQKFQDGRWDLILLDVVLPDGDGFNFGDEIQKQSQLKAIPLIFLTAQSGLSDRVLGFSIGADDYICKPFEPLELRARVESKLKKSRDRLSEPDSKRFGVIELQALSQKAFVWLSEQRKELDLTPIEFKILSCLCRHQGEVISRERLLQEVWGESTHVTSRSVDAHISKLRRKLGESAATIRSVHGSGYQFSS